MFSQFLRDRRYADVRIFFAAVLSLGIICSSIGIPAVVALADEVVPAESGEAPQENIVGEAGSSEASDETASITTGDAASTANVESQVNTNTVTASTTDSSIEAEDTTLSVENTNDATATTTAEADAGTGENEINDTGGNASIGTGAATSIADVTNIVNSNFLGSEGLFQFLNLFGNAYGDITLKAGDGASCNFLCAITQLFFANYNNANVSNDISANAATGANTATGNEGDAAIQTGNAFAAANAVNIINTNIVGSDYLTFILNAFGAWSGDLVLPPSSYFEHTAPACEGCLPENLSVTSENSADIENTVGASADSGGNEATGNDGASTINTGNAASASNVMTVANTNILGNNLMLIYVRTMGKWTGHVFSLPRGVTIIGTDDGFIIDGFGGGSALSTAASLNSEANWNITNTNAAIVRNNVSASATTGDNSASANGGDATINTGDAYAAANAINIVNTNILGRNWIFAILNVFGNWNGNVAFGRPDMWVGSSAEGVSPLLPDSEVAYTLTYRNNGNAAATNAVLTTTYSDRLNITSPNGGTVDTDAHTISWNLGTLQPGATGSVTFSAQGNNSAPTGSTHVNTTATLTQFETDANIADNTDALMLDMYRPGPSSSGKTSYARLEIKKSRVGEGSIQPGDEVAYKIEVINKGSRNAYKVVVTDQLKNASGEVVHEQSWNLDTITTTEASVNIDYTITFATTTPPGTYTNFALAEWSDENGNYEDHSGHSSASIEVVAAENTESNGGAAPFDSAQSESTTFQFNPGAVGPVLTASTVVGGDIDAEETVVEDEDEDDSDANANPLAVAAGTTGASLGVGSNLDHPVDNAESSLAPAAEETTLQELAEDARDSGWTWHNLLAGLPFGTWNYWYLLLAPLAVVLFLVLSRRRREN